MPKILAMMACALALTFAVACAADKSPVASTPTPEAVVSEHMIAEATLTAHYIAAALKAGMTLEEINAVLVEIADSAVIAEFWVSDENGRIEFTNQPGLEFTFETDPNAGTQSAPFARLLQGSQSVVVQDAQPRESDGAVFKYVGVAGVDQIRIVQIGLAATH